MYRKMRPSGSRSGLAGGMTLIEALVALGILAIVAVVSLSAISGAFNSASLARERTTAESLARSQLERIKSAPYEPAPPYYSPLAGIPDGYALDIVVTPLRDGLQKVRVSVSHWGKGVFAVEDYKVNR